MNRLATKNIVLIVVAAGIVGGAFYLTEYRNKDSVKTLYDSGITATTSPSLVDASANKVGADGLTQWERDLLGTQGIGVDGKPIKGWASATGTSAGGAAIEKLTATDKVGRAFFSRYMALQQQGIATDKESQEELVNDVLAGGILTSGPYIYSDREFKVGTDTSLDAVKKYGNTVGTIFKTYGIQSRNEAVIVQESLKTENPAILAELDPILASHKNITNNLVKTSVPPSLFEQHKALVQALSGIVFIVESFKKVNLDPIVSLQALATYQDTLKSMIESVEAIRNHLFVLGITYTPNEAGVMFNKN